ncbi:MAG TPA: hypothetical protein VEG60_18425 [Candidatus Binatia bacterium]|nr:hypothetical protein [Candidatus Binatia bacterium]
MVSNTLKMAQKDVIAALKRLRAQRSDDPEYKKLRKDLPKDWPI